MLENPFVSLLIDFQAAWARLNAEPFALETFHLNWYRHGFDNEHQPWDRQRDKIIGSLHLPFAVDAESGAAGVVTVPADQEREPARCAFVSLAARSGAALPNRIRDRLIVFCPWEVTEAASWWYALLWRLYGGAPQDPAGRFIDHLVLARPFLLSVHAIEVCGLNTDKPGFPEDADSEGSIEKNKKRGRPVASEVERKRDKTWYEAWQSGEYKTYADLAANLSTLDHLVKPNDVQRGIENHGKRLRRAGLKRVKER